MLFVLGGFGAAIHLLFLHWKQFEEGAAADVGPHVNDPLANIAFGLLGGLFYALLLRYPITESVRTRRVSPLALLKGAMAGAIASFATIQAFCIGGSCLVAYKGKMAVPDVSLGMAFGLAMLDSETYGIIAMFYFVIPALICGMLVTAVVARSFFQRASGRAS